MKHFNEFIEYSNDMDILNIEECNPNKKRKILTVSDDMIVHMLSNKKPNPTVTELYIIGRKLTSSLVLITMRLVHTSFKDSQSFCKWFIS